MEMHERLKLARELRGFESATDAAAAFGVPYGSYAGHENGSRGIKKDRLTKYAAFFGVSIPWLEHGIGDGPKALPADDNVVEVDIERFRAIPKERTFKQHLTEMRADSVRLEQAIAVAEGTLLAAGLKPEYLADVREIIQEALESPLVLSNPDAELDTRRALAQSNLARLLKKRDAQADKE